MRAGHLIADRYRLDEKIGGGMGVVWRATDLELGRSVAIKWAEAGEHDPFGRQPRREARIAAGLHHPHVVALFDVLRDNGERLLIMEYVPSRSLAEIIRDRGPLPIGEVAQIARQVASGLEALHANGIVHGDVKPANVLVTTDGIAKLTDFGISRVVWGELTRTDGDLIGGTPRFMAPEVANGRKATPAADLFSFGAMLLNAIDGDPAPGDDSLPAWRRAERGELSVPDRAGALRPVIAALLRVHPAGRPSATEVRERITEAGFGTPPGRIGIFHSARLRSITAHRLRTATIAAATVATAAIGAWALVNGFAPPPPAGLASGSVSQSSESSESPRPSVTRTPMVIGDPRTADPCALADPAPFGRFGRAAQSRDQGNFGRCDVLIESKGHKLADVKIEFAGPPETEAAPEGSIEKSGSVSIVTPPPATDECDRTVILADRYRVEISAVQNGTATADYCAIADAATTGAVAVVNRGPIPRRSGTFPAVSLAKQDACALLDGTALSQVPGIDAVRPQAGFADWECRWDSTTSPYSIRLRFDRNAPLNADDGQPTKVAGKAAFVSPDGDGDKTCLVRVVQRSFQDSEGQPTVELVDLVVNGPAPSSGLCAPATALARSAAGKLPPG